MELWQLTHSRPDHALRSAQRAEAAGWSGLAVVDSQNLAPDSYVALTLAATGTRRIGLGTGVTNPLTRHPAVTASAALAIQQISGGRMCLGIGRGDSALAHIGRSPARYTSFARYVEVVLKYLRGEAVGFDELPVDDAIAPPVEALELADHPTSSRIRWFDAGLPKVPLEIAATGPQVIALAGRVADRVMFTLGAVPERLRWGIEIARRACRDAGGDPEELRLGAYVNLVCHRDRTIARDLVRGGLTTFARFSVMHGRISGPVDTDTRRVLEELHDGYDMRRHTRADSLQATLMNDAFVDAFAIAGPPEYCLERLTELEALGIDKVVVSGPTAGTDPQAAREAMALLDETVVPVHAPGGRAGR